MENDSLITDMFGLLLARSKRVSAQGPGPDGKLRVWFEFTDGSSIRVYAEDARKRPETEEVWTPVQPAFAYTHPRIS